MSAAPDENYVNECEVDEGGCEGYCCNTIGSYYCKCPEGSKVGPDGKACNVVFSFCAVLHENRHAS
uniref:Uncharacterized protein n=1 Tax=Xiphophorus couchianus TaxID=32473 RepID=A0A3B5MBK2_9TELE